MSKFAVILPAAGSSSRFHDKAYRKPFAPLAQRSVWLHAADRFLNRDDVVQTVLVIHADDEEFFRMKFGANVAIMGIEVVHGGATRADSVQGALEKIREEVDFVAVHDAARPCLAEAWVDKVFSAAERHGAAILATPVTSTLKRVQGGLVQETVSRQALWEAQTPQVFRRQWLVDAYARRGDTDANDDAELVERAGHQVHVVECSRMNLKITTRDDMRLAEATLKALPKPKLRNLGNPFGDDDMWR